MESLRDHSCESDTIYNGLIVHHDNDTTVSHLFKRGQGVYGVFNKIFRYLLANTLATTNLCHFLPFNATIYATLQGARGGILTLNAYVPLIAEPYASGNDVNTQHD